MSYKKSSKYRKGSVGVFSLFLNSEKTIEINKVTNLINLKNEFYASISGKIISEKTGVYFEDKEAEEVFSAIIDPIIKKYLKFYSKATMGCSEYIKFYKLGLNEFTKNVIVCLDGDVLPEKLPPNNYLQLPSINNAPPKKFVFKILSDENSGFWRQTKEGYTYAVFMNNSHYQIIRLILQGAYGNEEGNQEGPFNTSGGPYYNVRPREVWKDWYKEEKNTLKEITTQ